MHHIPGDRLKEINAAMLEALERILPTAENWACYCEMNGEGVNNPAAVAVYHAKQAIQQAKGGE